MKVLQVGSGLHDWGGIERYISYLASGLSDLGHVVTVSCPAGSPLSRRVSVPQVAISNRGKRSLSALASYLKLFRRHSFDIVHVHYNPDFLMPTLAARMTRNGKVVMTRHVALPWSSHKVRLYTNRVDRIIGVSDAVNQILRESGVPSTLLSSAKAGTPALVPTRSSAETRADLKWGSEMRIGFFGRLVPEKGIHTAIEAARLTGIPLEIFGKGSSEEELRRAAVGAPVTFHGYREDIVDVMSAVDAVVVPSIWAEAFPFSILEAQSLGKPVIASEVGGLPEMVTQGVDGHLFPAGDASALGKILNQLDADQIARMSTAAQRRFEGGFTVEHFAKRVEQVYLAT